MSVSIKQQFKFMPIQEQNDLNRTTKAVQTEIDKLHAAITTLTAKMDTDFTAQNAAVTASQLDVNYATTVDPAATTLVD